VARQTSAVRASVTIGLCLLAACQGAPERPTTPPPPFVLVTEWPEGQRFATALAAGLPDLDRFRAAEVWWQQALGQTTRFSLAPGPADALPTVELTIDRQALALTATLVDAGRRSVLAAGRFDEASATPDLTSAIDRVAWAARLALGERVDAPPSPVAEITSRDPAVVVAVHEARALLEIGSVQAGYRALRRARQRDGGAPFVLQPLASCELLFGNADEAERICREAIGYARRSSPQNGHLLGRTLLLAQAGRHPQDVAVYDRRLLDLGTVATRERPHDDEAQYTLALAHNYRAEFERSEPLLRALAQRLPEHAFVHYHLGWALLANGDPAGAAAHLAEAALRIPASWVLLPRAIAMFECGQHAELDELLRATLAEHPDDPLLPHQVLRMQAAHAVLLGKPARARELLLADLEWLTRNALVLEQRSGEFAESGELLVRLGGDDRLAALLLAAQQLRSGTAVADACAYLSGMWQTSTRGRPSDGLVERLQRGGDSAWAARLEAFGHERAGEVGEMQTQLARASRLSSSPMTKALLAKSLCAVGNREEGEALHRALRRELRTIHLRRPCQHPLYGPELAYAFRLGDASAEQQ